MQSPNVPPLKHLKQLQSFQTINFPGTDDNNTVEVYGKVVTIVPSSGDHDTGSSKVKLQNVVDYTWEERFYTGQLLAVHMEGKYIAYGIKAISKCAGVVRVVNRESAERALIKGMEGMVQDIAFAHIAEEIILACVDQAGNLFIHKIEEEFQPARLICTLVLHISQDSESPTSGSHRVIWCPYIPDVEANDEDVARLLALTRGTKAEIWNIGMVTSQHGVGPVKPGDVEVGYLEISEHNQPIVDASFSPDGTAIATASMDGEVKFFQVHMRNVLKPRCLHQWQPHGGKPLSALFFLDNHKNYNPEVQFWKFAITGANDNSELKLWSCESWTCLQTIHFSARSDERIKLKPCLDLASGYLLLSDIYRKVLYVLQLHIGSNETLALILSVSEFLLPYPILSFGIVDAGIRRFKLNSSFSLDDLCTDEGEEESQLAVVVRMYLVQPKSLQECHIVFQPPKSGDKTNSVSLPQDSLIFRDALSDLSSSVEPISAPLQELPANHSSLQLNLMTPDAFNSPVKHESPASSTGNLNLSVLPHPDECYSKAVALSSPQSPDEVPTNGDVEAAVLMGFASGGSSPSREVQEILSLQGAKCFFQETDLQQQQPELDELTPPEEKTEPTVWPEIPILRVNDVRKNKAENSQRNVNSGQDMNGGTDAKIWKGNQRIESSLSSIVHSMNVLAQAVEDQATEIKALREDMKRQNYSRDLDKAMSSFAHDQNTILEKALNAKENRYNQEAIISAISQSVNNLVSTKLDDIVSSEITSNILPEVVSKLEALSHQLHIEMTQKLSATDALLKENIMKLVHSKTVMETLSTSLVTSSNLAMKDCFREYFSNFVIPAFEKACSSMFVQINDAFCRGTKDYVAMLESHTRKITEKNRDQTTELQALSEMIKNNSQQLSLDIKKSISNIEVSVNEAVTKALRLQQATLETSVLAAVRSGAVTPAPHVLDTQLQQHQILQLISQGQINAAFQQALSASDLSLVVYVCEKVNPQQVFNQSPCPLQQHVLLSLIQQLSADMLNHTEIKHKYLEEAVMNLDVTNSTTKEHLPNVLKHLYKQLQTYISSNPNNKITRSMRMLQMAAQSLLTTQNFVLPE